MKRMKKLISIRSIPVLALALLIVLGTALEAVPPTKVSGSGEWSATSDTPWFGSATLNIGGFEFPTVDLDGYRVHILETFQISDEGVYRSGKAEQVFDFGGANPNDPTDPGDTIRTLSTVVLEPTGEKPAEGNYTVKLKSWFISGTKRFEGITGGRLNVTGVIKFWPPEIHGGTSTANFTVQGSIEGSIIYP